MPIIPGAEKERRLAVESVIGTHRAEGIQLDATVYSLMDSFVAGEIDLPQFSAAMQRHAQSVATAIPLVGAA